MICAIDIEINNLANIYQTEYNSAKNSSVIHNLIITTYTIRRYCMKSFWISFGDSH